MKTSIILAAGLSSRMGCWKMLLPWGDGTVLDSAIHNALAFCDNVILVTGHRASELHRRYADREDVALCFNPAYLKGMFSSVQRGVAALSGTHFFVVPGDMPAIDPDVYASLWAHMGPLCLRPICDGGKGHPVLLPPALIPDILGSAQDGNLRQLMQRHGCENIPVTCKGILWDLDTPMQYQALLNSTR